ncbi:MAG: TetR/AcrR family transcriptional regulator [Candidatus Zixiibacteriota bacterium]
MSNALKIKQSPKLPAELRREQLLKSAHELFVKQGYRGTSTEDIARNAGLTKGALYFHYKSKEEILLALIKHITEGYRAELDRVLPRPARPQDIIHAVLQNKKCTQIREFSGIMDIWVQAIRIPRVHRFITETHRRMVTYFCDLIDPSLGYTRQELRRLTVLVLAIADGLAVHRVLHPGTIQIPQQIALFESLLASHARAKNGGRAAYTHRTASRTRRTR